MKNYLRKDNQTSNCLLNQTDINNNNNYSLKAFFANSQSGFQKHSPLIQNEFGTQKTVLQKRYPNQQEDAKVQKQKQLRTIH